MSRDEMQKINDKLEFSVNSLKLENQQLERQIKTLLSKEQDA